MSCLWSWSVVWLMRNFATNSWRQMIQQWKNSSKSPSNGTPLIKSVIRWEGTRDPTVTGFLRTKMIKRTTSSVKIKDARALNHVQRDRTKMVIVISVLDRSKTNVLKVNVESKSKIGSVKTVANGVTTKRHVYRRNQLQRHRKQLVRLEPARIVWKLRINEVKMARREPPVAKSRPLTITKTHPSRTWWLSPNTTNVSSLILCPTPDRLKDWSPKTLSKNTTWLSTVKTNETFKLQMATQCIALVPWTLV